MRKIICLFILVICFVSCNKENHVYYFYDGGSKDTTISIKFLDKKAFEIRPRVKIVLKDSIYGKNSIEDLFGNTDFKHLLESEKSINVCDFFLYKEEESFSDFELYTDSNYYLKGHVVFLENGKPLLSLLFENSYLRDKILKREQREREIKDSIRRDSIIEARRQNQMELAFMGYELGKSYSNSKGEKKKLLERDYKMKVCHYDDTIYQIRIEFSDYKKGLYKLGDDVINLYRYKYGRESESNDGFYTEIKEWVYSNGKIKIEIEKREFDHRGHIISKNASKPTAYIPTKNVVEVVITYLDYKADSVATQKRKREFLGSPVKPCVWIFIILLDCKPIVSQM